MQINSSTIGLLTHDLKGPVGNVTMFSEMLVGMLQSAQQELGSSYDLSTSIWYGQYIQVITAKYMDQLQNWADIYYLKAGKAHLNPTLIDFGRLVKKVIQDNQIFIEKKRLLLKTEIESALMVDFDEDVLRRILDNLIQLVVLLVNQDKEITFVLEKHENTIRFKMKGLPLNDKPLLEKLFLNEPDLSDNHLFTKGLIKTTGIGLAFCYVAITHAKGSPFLNELPNEQLLEVGFNLSSAV